MEYMKILKGTSLIDMGIHKDSDGYLVGSLFFYETNETSSYSKRINIEKLKVQLGKIENELSKCRTSVMEDGWQTMKYAKKARKWDVLAQEKMKIIQILNDCE